MKKFLVKIKNGIKLLFLKRDGRLFFFCTLCIVIVVCILEACIIFSGPPSTKKGIGLVFIVIFAIITLEFYINDLENLKDIVVYKIILSLSRKIKTLRFPLFQKLLPKNRREEILGDLFELSASLKTSGKSPRRIKWILFSQKLSILFAFFIEQLRSAFSFRTKVNGD